MLRFSRGLLEPGSLRAISVSLPTSPTSSLGSFILRYASNDSGKKIQNELISKKSATKSKQEEQVNESSEDSQNKPKDENYIEINLFGPKDARAPLPGNVGISLPKYDPLHVPIPKVEEFELIVKHKKDGNNDQTTTVEQQLIQFESMEDRQNYVLETAIYNYSVDFDIAKQFAEIHQHLDIRVFECPKLLTKDLQDMQIRKSFECGKVLMITVNQLPKIKNSNYDIKSVKEKAISLLNQMSTLLSNAGFWSEFIYPNKECIDFTNKHTNLDMIKLFQRYCFKHVNVKNFDTCKVMQFKDQGPRKSHLLGTLFTDAELDSHLLKPILQKLTASF